MSAYTRTNWQNTPSTNTPLNAANLNHMEEGIYNAQNAADAAQATADETVTKLDALQAREEASTVAAMTDHSKVYIYTGNETGYNFGHWYYWNGSAWTDGGAYNSAGVNTDTTLSVSGAPADAKATGDKVGELKSALSDSVKNVASYVRSNKYFVPITLSWEQGAISADGSEIALNTRIRTPYINVANVVSYVLVLVESGYETFVLVYDESKTVKNTYSWTTGNRRIPISTNSFIRIVLRRVNSSEDIATSEGSNCTCGDMFDGLPMRCTFIDGSGHTTLKDNDFLSNCIFYVNANASALYSDLPSVYSSESITTFFAITIPLTWNYTANTTEYLYQQIVFNNSINKFHFRVVQNNNGTWSTLRDWSVMGENTVNIPQPYLNGKKGIFLGDSISYGLYSYWDGSNRKNSDGLSPDYANPRISDYFAQLTGMTVTNIAARGTGWVADTRNLGNALTKATNTDFSTYDFVGLCFGINDYIRAERIGSLQEDAQGTICGNMSRVFKKIYQDNPLAKVVVFSPYNAWGQVAVNQGVDYYYGDESTNYALGYANSRGDTLQDIVDAIDEVCQHYGVTHERLNKSNVVNRINIKDIMIDGLHPSRESMPMLAAEMFAQKDFG